MKALPAILLILLLLSACIQSTQAPPANNDDNTDTELEKILNQSTHSSEETVLDELQKSFG
ncbi:MAG: hypothetical protein HY917_04895 [Candidatus Diapherotrites archaeon]|nr:hypothetical protein [Candidatus Diapherotrites archaeon]